MIVVRGRGSVALWCAVAILVATTGAGESVDERFVEIRRGIAEKVDSGDLPSIAVSVFTDGEMLWEEAIGWADRERKVPATLNSIYGLGSLSKSITATGLMVLVEQGLVDLDAPVDGYLGDQKLTPCFQSDETITVRHLLNCSAGIPHGWFSYVLGDEPAFADGDEYVRRFGLAAFPPGERFLYSNHAYGIAREIIAGASGRSYEDFMRTEVFEPLGMTSSGLGIVVTSDDVARGHLGGEVLPKDLVTGPVGGATLFSSVSDLMRYARFHLGRPLSDQTRILSPESLEAMHSDRDETLPGSLMALGWGVIELGEKGRLLVSNGEVTGANSTVLLLPESGVAIVVLANEAHSPSISDATSFAIAEALSPGFMDSIGAVIEEIEAHRGGSYEPTAEVLGEWAGKITTAEGSVPLRFRFQEDGDIHLRIGDGLWTLLDRKAISAGVIEGSCTGSLPGPEGVERGTLSFYLAPGDGGIGGYVTWITRRVDSGGDDWSLVLPGCISLSRERTAGDELQAAADAFLKPYVDSRNFSGSVLIASGDEILVDSGYGPASIEHSVVNTPKTRFRIGSISKTFTAAAIMLLQEGGSLRIDDPISRYLPVFPNGEAITIRHLLGHTSGLPRYVFQPDYVERSQRPHTASDLVDWVAELPPAWPPGTRAAYSNANYAVLAAIIEVVSGQTYGAFLEAEIFEPLGLDDTGHAHDALEIVPRLASAYQPVGRSDFARSRAYDYSSMTGAGSLFSTTHDLLSWYRSLRRGDLLNEESLALFFSRDEAVETYAWRVTEHANRAAVSAQGWDGIGFSGKILHLENDDLTVIVLCNLNISGISSELVSGLTAIALGEGHETFELAFEAVAPSASGKVAGVYRFGADFYVPNTTIELVEENGALLVAGPQQGALLRLSDGEYIHRQHWFRVSFQRDDSGVVTGMSYGRFEAQRETVE